MVKTLLQIWEEEFNIDLLQHLIVYEARLVPEMARFNLIINFPSLQKLPITKDSQQSLAYTGSISERTASLGHKGVIHKLIRNDLPKHVILTGNFKSQKIVKAFADAFYYGKLVLVLKYEEKN